MDECKPLLVGNLTNKELMNYTSVFDGSIGGKAGDQSKLAAVDRRYAWVKRNLKAGAYTCSLQSST